MIHENGFKNKLRKLVKISSQSAEITTKNKYIINNLATEKRFREVTFSESFLFGGLCGARTHDILVVTQALSQLS